MGDVIHSLFGGEKPAHGFNNVNTGIAMWGILSAQGNV